MLTNFQTPSILLGLFLRKFDVQDFQSFAETLPWRLPEFDADPQLNRLPENAPADQPRVRFVSKDQRYLLEAGPNKVHFRMMPGEIQQTERGANVQALPVAKAFENFIPQAMRVHTTLSEHFGATANRLGVVTDIIAPTPSSSNQRMQQSILGGKNLLGERLHDLQIQALAKTRLPGDLGVNRRITVRSMRTGAQGNPDLLMSIQVDINTLAEEPYDISTSDLEAFLKGVVSHMETEVPLLEEKAFFE